MYDVSSELCRNTAVLLFAGWLSQSHERNTDKNNFWTVSSHSNISFLFHTLKKIAEAKGDRVIRVKVYMYSIW